MAGPALPALLLAGKSEGRIRATIEDLPLPASLLKAGLTCWRRSKFREALSVIARGSVTVPTAFLGLSFAE